MVVPDDIGASGQDEIRVSDADRDKVLAELRVGYVEGRLTHDTFAHRVEAVLLARAGRDLRSVVADLPRPRGIWVRATAIFRRASRTTDRWLRGRPPVLALPRGSQPRFTIGREARCDMTLADETVSRWHASLERAETGWILADLGSMNGTRLNGWRVTGPVPVQAGDMVSFGGSTYLVSDRPR
ncbi:MAG TPA: DUF1707 and FHA domain-containing protein [Streptosporangiaceae bacterium]|nr:DUF1707 and FHA domain-containing protein [Streptosporangiaceae bacterium]